jgi:hypothetical protein
VTDGWYPLAADYWVDPSEAGDYPLRQGDLFMAVETPYGHWDACQLIHPTCELAKAAVSEVQVIRVHRLDEIEDSGQQAAVVAGFRERNGVIGVAHAHTFFLAPAGGGPLFSNFREVAVVSKAELPERRLAAMTHDTRVTFIRRALYFRYRILISLDDVRSWEATRIRNDPHFSGPRHEWAPPAEGLA